MGRDETGLALVEFALVLPFFVAAFLSMIDVGMALFIRSQVQTAAQAGATYAALNTFDAAAISTAATSATSTAVTVATPTAYYACDNDGVLQTVGDKSNCSGGLPSQRYASLTVSAVYTPILSGPWQALTGSSTVTLSFTVVSPTT